MKIRSERGREALYIAGFHTRFFAGGGEVIVKVVVVYVSY